MKTYIGTKIIQAEPQAKNYGPTDGHGAAGYKVVYPDGYTSWSPASAFEEAYRETSGLTFGLALEALKKGERVARSGWNGKGMWIRYVPKKHDGQFCMNAHFVIKNVGDSFSTWVPSVNDCLADDWLIVGA